jgi:hypothetical protein
LPWQQLLLLLLLKQPVTHASCTEVLLLLLQLSCLQSQE